MATEEDKELTGDSGQGSQGGSGAVQTNKFKTAAKTLKDINFIDKAIKVYFMDTFLGMIQMTSNSGQTGLIIFWIPTGMSQGSSF